MNSKHKNINFSFETKKDGQMPFLDVNVFPENGKFMTNVYRKKTFIVVVVYTNFSSFIPLEHQFGLVYTLLHRCFCFATDMSKFHFEIEKLKKKYFYLMMMMMMNCFCGMVDRRKAFSLISSRDHCQRSSPS